MRCHASCSCSSSTDGGSAARAARPDVSPRAPSRGLSLGQRPLRPRSSWSRRNASASRDMSAAGRVTFTSASSSGRRGSPPWRMSSTATASRSISRTTTGAPSWFACAASRSRVSSVSGSESGTSPMCWTSISARRCSSRSSTSRPMSCPCAASCSTNVSAPAVSPSTTRSQSRKSASSSTAPSSCRTSCTVIRPSVAAASWSSVDSASRYAPRAPRAIERERLVRHVDLLRVRDQAQLLHELREPRPLEDERLAARANGRQDLREVGRAEDEDEVRRRLLDQLQQRVPRRVRELVRLVEDVDLVAPLRRLEHDALADLADVVDAALRRRVHLDHVERRAVRDRDARVARLVRVRRRPLRAVQPLREDARERRLPGAARPGEDVRLPHLPRGDRVLERADDRLLPDDLVEVLRAVLAVEGGHASIQAELGSRCARARSPKPSRSRPSCSCSCGAPSI